MNVSPGDLVDRFSIVKLKMERTEDKPVQEHNLYDSEFKTLKVQYHQIDWDLLLDIAYRANGLVWDLEGAIRTSQLDDDFVEAGKRAILCRKVNGIRVGIRNLVNSLTGQGFLEAKKHHLSE